jgi:hypothetical protein
VVRRRPVARISRPAITVANRLAGDVTLGHIYIDNVEVSGYGYYGITISTATSRRRARGIASARTTWRESVRDERV